MAADIINLRRARKARDRNASRKAANANAARSGRTKAARETEAGAAEIARRRFDGHKIEDRKATGPDADDEDNE